MAGNSEQISETKYVQDPKDNFVWNANQIETDGVRVLDPGVGKENVLRHFFFKSLPLPPRTPRPSKIEIINQFKRLIEASLYGDGLIIREDKPIELYTRNKVKKISKTLYLEMLKNNADFCILVLATPRMGVTVLESPLQAL
jgi:hypothetical protein